MSETGATYPATIPTQTAAGGLERIYDEIQVLAPGVLLPVVQMALFDAIEEFCVKSQLWRTSIGWTMASGVASVDLNTTPFLTGVARVMQVLSVTGITALQIVPPGVIVETGPTGTTRSGTALVVLKPLALAEPETIPDFIINDYAETLRDGALFRIFGQPAKPYSNPDLAKYHGGRFTEALEAARWQATTQHSGNGLARIYDALRIEVPDATLPMVQTALRDAVEAFCIGSTLYRISVPWTMAGGVASIDLNTLPALANASARAMQVLSTTGVTSLQIQPPAVIVELGPTAAARSGTALVACKPVSLADQPTIPQFVLDDWTETIRDGALARLFGQAGKSWFDKDLAKAHGDAFAAAIDTARDKALTEHSESGLARIYDAIRAEAPAASLPLVQTALRDTAEDFCVRSSIYRISVPWTMTAGVSSIDLNTLAPVTSVNARAMAVLSTTGMTSQQVQPPATLIELDAPTVAATRSGTALVACKPLSLADSPNIPTWILDDYTETLRSGALARLLAQPDRPWSDDSDKMARTQMHLARYADGVTRAREQSRTEHSQSGLARIYDMIRMDVPEASLSTVQAALRDAVEEFCVRSTFYRNQVYWNMAIGQGSIDLNSLPWTIDLNARATAVVWVQGVRVLQKRPPAVIIEAGDTTQARYGSALVVCKPASLSDEPTVPSFILDDYSEGIRDGALSRLYLMPRKPWTDAKLATYHGQRFRDQIRLARDIARTFNDFNQWRFPYFARGRQFAWGFGGGYGSENSFYGDNDIPQGYDYDKTDFGADFK